MTAADSVTNPVRSGRFPMHSAHPGSNPCDSAVVWNRRSLRSRSCFPSWLHCSSWTLPMFSHDSFSKQVLCLYLTNALFIYYSVTCLAHRKVSLYHERPCRPWVSPVGDKQMEKNKINVRLQFTWREMEVAARWHGRGTRNTGHAPEVTFADSGKSVRCAGVPATCIRDEEAKRTAAQGYWMLSCLTDQRSIN